MSNASSRQMVIDADRQAATVSPEAAGPVDKSARLAIEAGPGHGFQNAIRAMASAVVDTMDETRTETLEAARDEQTADLIEQVGIDDLAFAAREMNIKRLVVVTPFPDTASRNTVLTLARILAEENHPVALLQLDGETPSPAENEQEGGLTGWIDLLGGGRTVSDIIHNDPESQLHITPSGGLDVGALDEDQVEDLTFYLKAFAEAYAMTVIHTPLDALGHIDGLDNGETAIIVAAHETMGREIEAIATDINVTSRYDLLHLVSEDDARVYH